VKTAKTSTLKSAGLLFDDIATEIGFPLALLDLTKRASKNAAVLTDLQFNAGSFAAIKSWAGRQRETKVGLVMFGVTGSCKTLMACVLLYNHFQAFGEPLLYTSLAELTHLEFAVQTTKEFPAHVSRPSLLVIDDIDDVQKVELQCLARVLSLRRHRQGTTILCTRMTPNEFKDELSPKPRSILEQEFLWVECDAVKTKPLIERYA